MSTIVPNTQLGKVQFYEEHNAPWTANATAIGLLSGDVTSMGTKTLAARAAYNAHTAAQLTSKAATQTYSDAVNTMATFGSTLIKKIKVKAATDGAGVYALAQIPAPALPTPVGPPGMPFGFVATLQPNGSLELTWKCTNPSGAGGTNYDVSRKLSTESDFTSIGKTGKKTFLDTTVPGAVAQITYQITAFRSTATGTAAQFLVNFGVSGGTMTASVVPPSSAPRMAA